MLFTSFFVRKRSSERIKRPQKQAIPCLSKSVKKKQKKKKKKKIKQNRKMVGGEKDFEYVFGGKIYVEGGREKNMGEKERERERG